MQIRIFETKEEIAAAAADVYAGLLAKKPDAVLGFATGASPLPTYAELIRRCEAGAISFKDVKTFNLDEYCGLPADDENSYRTFMFRNLFSQIDLRPENAHLLDGNAPDEEAEARRYDRMRSCMRISLVMGTVLVGGLALVMLLLCAPCAAAP